jgi:hypothetical protein
LGWCKTLIGGFAIPKKCFWIVLWNALTELKHVKCEANSVQWKSRLGASSPL